MFCLCPCLRVGGHAFTWDVRLTKIQKIGGGGGGSFFCPRRICSCPPRSESTHIDTLPFFGNKVGSYSSVLQALQSFKVMVLIVICFSK